MCIVTCGFTVIKSTLSTLSEHTCTLSQFLCVRYIDLESREKTDPESVHIINIDIQDNQEEATIGAFMICDLCTLVRTAEISCCMLLLFTGLC